MTFVSRRLYCVIPAAIFSSFLATQDPQPFASSWPSQQRTWIGPEYWANTAWFMGWWEPVMGLVKATFFGFAIGMISCYKGFTCRGGAAGVGKATTSAFVASFIAIMILNFVLADFLNALELIVIGGTVKSPL